MTNAPSTGTSVMGQRLGRYELLGEIASGGMATVYLGRALGVKGFTRLVAIKRLHPHLERDEDFVSMFLDEARLAARIRHPNVVPTLDVDDQDGLYIVMEYIEGDRLLGLLRYASRNGERLPPPVVLKIAIETLSGLHAAHELTEDDGTPLNLVHRDVSPQNVLVGIDGITKITDFGIAKAESRLTTTRDGQLKGKIAYMAPEQTRGGEIDRRVDIFAMGILIWEMLTAQRLFHGENDVEVLNGVLNSPIPNVRSVVPDLPAELDDVVMRALNREHTLRWDTAADFADALEEVAGLVGGVASARAVAAHVLKVAGPKLEQERVRLRTGTSAPGLAEPGTSPSRPFGSDKSGVGIRTGPGASKNSYSADTIAAGPSSKQRRGLVIAVAIVALFGMGGIGFLIRGSSNPSTPTATPSVAPHALTPVQTTAPPPVPTVAPPTAPTGHELPAVLPSSSADGTAHGPAAAHATGAHANAGHGGGGPRRHGSSSASSTNSGANGGTAAPTTAPAAHHDEDFDPVSVNPYRH